MNSLYLSVQKYRKVMTLYLKTIDQTRGRPTHSFVDLLLLRRSLSQGFIDEAAELYKNAIDLSKGALGLAHPEYYAMLNNYAGILDIQVNSYEARVDWILHIRHVEIS